MNRIKSPRRDYPQFRLLIYLFLLLIVIPFKAYADPMDSGWIRDCEGNECMLKRSLKRSGNKACPAGTALILHSSQGRAYMVLEIPVIVRTDLTLTKGHPELTSADSKSFLNRIRATINYPMGSQSPANPESMVLRPNTSSKLMGKTRVVFRLEPEHLEGLIRAKEISVGQLVKGQYDQWNAYPLDDQVSDFAALIPEYKF